MADAVSILLVEDNDDDAELTLMAFKRAGIQVSIVRVSDGIEALDYLFRRRAHAGRSDGEPALVLLDLNMPRLGGVGVLDAIRASDSHRYLPVIILTSSNQDRDRHAAYVHQVNSYIRKPVDFEQFVDATRVMARYWLSINQPPPKLGTA
jgi:two-component system response regulator